MRPIRRRSAGLRARATALAAAALLGVPGPAPAVEAYVHGLLDLVATGNGEAILLNSLYRGDTAFDAYRVRLFVDGAVTDRIHVHTQLLFAEASGARAGSPGEESDRYDLVAAQLSIRF